MCCNSNGSCKGCKCGPAKIGKWLLVIGGLNWGLVGLGMLFGGMGWDVVGMIFGSMPVLQGIVYLLIGVSAVMCLFSCKCKKCMGGTCAADGGKMDGGMQGKM
jgi:uncharacterized membrane protein YuzA (DUF378 family)